LIKELKLKRKFTAINISTGLITITDYMYIKKKKKNKRTGGKDGI